MVFLSYDIKGIQNIIFGIPRLKGIVGASGDVAELDRKFGALHSPAEGVRRIFAAGGRGVFQVNDEQLDGLIKLIVSETNEKGFDVRIGVDEELDKATQNADRLYPYLPSDMRGFPCTESGLLPAGSGRRVSQIFANRIKGAKKDELGKSILDDPGLTFKTKVPCAAAFFKNVNPEYEQEELANFLPNDYRNGLDEIARTAKRVLGGRNRWAIVALDGNDIGQLYDNLYDKYKQDQNLYAEKLEQTSQAISTATRDSFLFALNECLEFWYARILDRNKQICICKDSDGNQQFLLPFRPLILGGDDVVLICHSALAIKFVETMSMKFTELAGRKENGPAFELAKGKFLTMSAGVLFCKTSLPLHTAIPYAEQLLANAKNQYRSNDPNQATPAAVDWETITDTMIDHPVARRNRELRFIDEEINRAIHLTRRPYLLRPAEYDPGKQFERSSLESLKGEGGVYSILKELPNSFRAELGARMKSVWSERMRYLISIAKDKRYELLSFSLRHSSDGGFKKDKCGFQVEGTAWLAPQTRNPFTGEWEPQTDDGKQILSTDVLDAILLLDEEHREKQGSRS